MKDLIVLNDGIKKMSSMDLAELCGQTHANFMKKVVKVLKGGEVKFYSTYLDKSNRQSKCYYFPEREACLMAMSYSYELQARVYDAWRDAENRVKELLGASGRKAISNYRKGIRGGKAVSKELQEDLSNPLGMIPKLAEISSGVNVMPNGREQFWKETRTTVRMLRDKYRKESKLFETQIYSDYEVVEHYCTKRIAQVR